MIILAATPLGDPADASSKLLRLLASADIVAAEDTRRVRRLASDLGVRISGRVVSFYDAVEAAKSADLIAAAADGATVLVVSDAGTPVVSDPGYRLVAAAVEAGIPVQVAPGPSAVTAALAVSGLPSDRFTFEGFLPRRPGELARELADLATEPRTMVFFESPRRLPASLAAMVLAFGEQRPVAVCRELTKTYEEVVRGPVAQVAAALGDQVRGEITIVVAGCRDTGASWTDAELADAVTTQMAAGSSRRDSAAVVAERLGVPRRRVYQASLAAASQSHGTAATDVEPPRP
jgi:16S rRNA (cytidine1402-2'-O)-methyltransferase